MKNLLFFFLFFAALSAQAQLPGATNTLQYKLKQAVDTVTFTDIVFSIGKPYQVNDSSFVDIRVLLTSQPNQDEYIQKNKTVKRLPAAVLNILSFDVQEMKLKADKRSLNALLKSYGIQVE